MLQCDHCDYATSEDTSMLNHVNAVHSAHNDQVHNSRSDNSIQNKSVKSHTETNQEKTSNTCNNCGTVFDKATDLVAHIVRVHGFKYSGKIKNRHFPMKYPEQVFNQTQQQAPATTEIGCFDCPNKFHSKHELMDHKRQVHYKKKLCSFFHGNGHGCRFPPNICFNIHNENITPTVFENSDPRSRVPCKNGKSCIWIQRGGCYYKHVTNVEQSSARRSTTQATHSIPTGQSQQVEGGENRNFMMNTLMRMNQNLQTLSQKLQFLDLQSMTDFPNLGNGQRMN